MPPPLDPARRARRTGHCRSPAPRPPAACAAPIVSRFTPPSTAIGSERPLRSVSSRSHASLGSTSRMNACPPKPGWTVITSSRSTASRNGSTASAGVSGLMAIPACRPAWRIAPMTRAASSSASTWKTIRSLPARAKRSTYWSGALIIRWAWNGRTECGRRASTTTGPKLMLSTKWPSITSRWIESTPAASARSTSSPSAEKSAFRMLALICAPLIGRRPRPWQAGPAAAAPCLRAGRAAGRRRRRSLARGYRGR